MNKVKLAIMVVSMMTLCNDAWAGGLLTNTNQNIAFNRMMSRDAAIGIDGVYSNPAGVAFMKDGAHLSLNWQLVFQTRVIKNQYPLFANNVNDPTTDRKFKGTAFAPVLPSIQFAYNWNRFSFQGHFGIVGGGGKCEFSDGLGSFEKIVSETAMGVSQLAGAIDQVASAYGTPTQLGTMFSPNGTYSFNSYMRGRQYYYGLSLGTAYKLTPDLAVSVGVRGVYAMSNYYGYVKSIQVGSVPLYRVLDPSKTESADIELNCDQTGVGFTPILGIDYRLGRFNLAAKYEFKTRFRLKNTSVNRVPSIGNLPENLVNMGIPQAVVASPVISGAMMQMKQTFDQKIEKSIGEYIDGGKIAADLPALLTVGASYKPIDPLRINAGFHYFFDKQASAYEHREDDLKRGTMEWNAGVEYDASKLVTVSAGWQSTNYGLSDKYMNDRSFVVNSNSIGVGACLHITKKMDLNIAYFCTLYKHYKTSEPQQLSQTVNVNFESDYTRSNNVFGVGLDIDI